MSFGGRASPEAAGLFLAVELLSSQGTRGDQRFNASRWSCLASAEPPGGLQGPLRRCGTLRSPADPSVHPSPTHPCTLPSVHPVSVDPPSSYSSLSPSPPPSSMRLSTHRALAPSSVPGGDTAAMGHSAGPLGGHLEWRPSDQQRPSLSRPESPESANRPACGGGETGRESPGDRVTAQRPSPHRPRVQGPGPRATVSGGPHQGEAPGCCWGLVLGWEREAEAARAEGGRR